MNDSAAQQLQMQIIINIKNQNVINTTLIVKLALDNHWDNSVLVAPRISDNDNSREPYS